MNSKKKWLMILVMTFCSIGLFAQRKSQYTRCDYNCDGESVLGIYRYKFEWDDTTYSEDFLITRYYVVERYWGGEKDSIWQSNTYSSRISYYTVFDHLNVSNYQKHWQILAPFSAFAFREPFLCNPRCEVQRGAFLTQVAASPLSNVKF